MVAIEVSVLRWGRYGVVLGMTATQRDRDTAMIVIKMPGGDIEHVDANELLWMREAFDHEFKNAVLLRIGSDRIFSVESLTDLRSKFEQAGVAIARFTPPDGQIAMLVAADKVREVEPSNPAIFHEKARAILKFGVKLRLAVRETEAEAQSILNGAKSPHGTVNVATVVGGAVVGAVVGAAAAAALPANPKAEDQQ